MKKQIALFASGSGTNVENIVNYFKAHEAVSVTLVLCNNPKAPVIQRADRLGIACRVFNRATFYETDEILHLLRDEQIDLIVLAGFLWLVPPAIVSAYPSRILNIHPALLPKYGGKGMYGHHVHEAVKANQEKETGITIHFADAAYDEGRVVMQKRCALRDSDAVEDIVAKVHALEYEFYPQAIEQVALAL